MVKRRLEDIAPSKKPSLPSNKKKSRSPTSIEKERILKRLEQQCFDTTDPVTLNEFSELSLKDLKSVLKLATAGTTKKRCYELGTFQELLKQPNPKHPANRVPITSKDIEAFDQFRAFRLFTRIDDKPVIITTEDFHLILAAAHRKSSITLEIKDGRRRVWKHLFDYDNGKGVVCMGTFCKLFREGKLVQREFLNKNQKKWSASRDTRRDQRTGYGLSIAEIPTLPFDATAKFGKSNPSSIDYGKLQPKLNAITRFTAAMYVFGYY
jgi:hypothetical protein